MKERPILFSGDMVRAILEGRKTQTRRIVKPVRGFEHHGICKPEMVHDPWSVWWHGDETDRVGCLQECPYPKPGNTLWVREQLKRLDGSPWRYAADWQPVIVGKENISASIVWAHHKKQDYCPSIHMPRWASRITLEITAVRVERLQEISESDANAEGVEQYPPFTSVALFRMLWSNIHGPNAWDQNPWVWVIEFRKIRAA